MPPGPRPARPESGCGVGPVLWCRVPRGSATGPCGLSCPVHHARLARCVSKVRARPLSMCDEFSALERDCIRSTANLTAPACVPGALRQRFEVHCMPQGASVATSSSADYTTETPCGTTLRHRALVHERAASQYTTAPSVVKNGAPCRRRARPVQLARRLGLAFSAGVGPVRP